MRFASLGVAVLAGAALVAGPAGEAARAHPRVAAPRGDATRQENARRGTPHWQLRASTGRSIEGYASALSVIAGHKLALHVSTTPAARYRVEVYRLGWYHGAGARRVMCVPGCRNSRRGHSQPLPAPAPPTFEVSANWPVTDTIRTSRTWVSGEYLAQLVLARRGRTRVGRSVPFVVRATNAARDAVLVEVPVNTWEAYNNWGGKSLYSFNSSNGVPAAAVSFARPWGYGEPNLTFPVKFEYPMLRFLERSGFPLDYVTDVDVDRRPGRLLEHRLAIVLGHGEYWSPRIRAAWDAARAAGHNLAFLGANIGYWQMRYVDDHRTIVEYRSAALDPDPEPADKTTAFRALDPPRPECRLLGVEFQGGGLNPPLVNPYTVVAASDRWVRAAGWRAGDRLARAVRGEWDAVQPGCVSPAPRVLLRYAGASPAEATLTRTAGGGRVLALGTEGFGGLVDGWGKPRCHVDVHAERFLRVALADLAGLTTRELEPRAAACPGR